MTLASPLLVALGSGLYLGVMLGPGPRDGVMSAMYRRGVPIWQARLIIEAVPFIIGAILGGRVGWGTGLLAGGHRPRGEPVDEAVHLAHSALALDRRLQRPGGSGRGVHRTDRRRPGFPSH